MQDIIRHLPIVVYEYAFFPDGHQRFNYLSERSADILGVECKQEQDALAALKSLCADDDVVLLQTAFSRSKEPVTNGSAVVIMEVHGVRKRISLSYNDELRTDGAMLRRGFFQEMADPLRQAGVQVNEYEALLERLPIGVVIHHQGKISFANAHAHTLVGASQPRQLLGMNPLDFVHPDFVPAIANRMQQVLAGAFVPMVEEKFLKLDGTLIDVETMAFPFTYKRREGVQVIFRDITEKKRNEVRTRKNQTLFRQLFQNIPIALVMLDEAGKVAEVNPGFEKMFGYSKNTLEGKNLNDFIVPEDLRGEGIDLNNLIASNRVVSVESIRKHRDGQLVNVILYGVPIVQDNHVIGIYGVYVDITERKRVEEELKIRNTELDNFVYKVSHDLRAPLSSVLGLVNLSRVEGNTDDLLEYMRLIGEKIKALDRFIGDVLSHSKNLKLEVDISCVNLQEIVEQTFTDLGYLEEARQMKRSVKIEGIEFYSDRWRVSEIFRNLLSNAIKYRKPGSADAEIVIKVHVDHLCADIIFADNGIGIKEASLKRIFEMFYRGTDQGGGSGIGLYIVKNAVEKLGGQIKVSSAAGEGTRFQVLLPNRINSILGVSTTKRT